MNQVILLKYVGNTLIFFMLILYIAKLFREDRTESYGSSLEDSRVA